MISLKSNLTIIFLLIFLAYFCKDSYTHFTNEENKPLSDICLNEMKNYYNRLSSSEACFIKSVLFLKKDEFDDDFGYAYNSQFIDFILIESFYKPKQFCTMIFASVKNELESDSDSDDEENLDDSKLDAGSNVGSLGSFYESDSEDEGEEENVNIINDILSIKFDIQESKNILDEEIKFQHKKLKEFFIRLSNNSKSEDGDLKKSVSDLSTTTNVLNDPTIINEDNIYVKGCKNELEKNGFPEDASIELFNFILNEKNLDDFKHSAFSTAYMYHAAINLKIHQLMDQPKRFCLDHSNDIFLKLWRSTPFNIDETKLYNDKISSCKQRFKKTFGFDKNYKDVADHIMLNMKILEIQEEDTVGEYIELMVKFLRAGTINTPKQFCEDYGNIPSWIHRHRRRNDILKEHKLLNDDHSNFPISQKKHENKNFSDNMDFSNYKNKQNDACIAQLALDGFFNNLKLIEIVQYAFKEINISAVANRQFSNDYLYHIKDNYSISYNMHSIQKFCYNDAIKITPSHAILVDIQA